MITLLGAGYHGILWTKVMLSHVGFRPNHFLVTTPWHHWVTRPCYFRLFLFHTHSTSTTFSSVILEVLDFKPRQGIRPKPHQYISWPVYVRPQTGLSLWILSSAMPHIHNQLTFQFNRGLKITDTFTDYLFRICWRKATQNPSKRAQSRKWTSTLYSYSHNTWWQCGSKQRLLINDDTASFVPQKYLSTTVNKQRF